MNYPALPHLLRTFLLAAFMAAPSLRAEDAAELPPLDWTLGTGDLKGPLSFFGAEAMRTTNVVRQGHDALTATWAGHPKYGEAFTVTVTWQRTPDGLWSGGLAYSGYRGSRFIEEIHFPRLSAACDADAAFLFGGDHSGRLYAVGSGPLRPGSRFRRDYCGGMQFSALLRTNGTSLYLDHRDPAVSVKECEIAVSADGRCFTYTGIHIPGLPGKPAADYRIPYPSCYTRFQGGWFEAGQLYKKWGTAQSWHASRRGVNPMRRIGIWVWNRGRIDDALPPVERLQKALGAIPVALDWYWWHSNPYDTDYPDFWPPREGVEPFRAAVARLKRQG
ncbi:MAG: DUF6259 domain-containing protein, partial [Kiritimatiellia bacterium]|nr:DUF6259 domain-containing protein [Kiritimatiellia bacterium]